MFLVKLVSQYMQVCEKPCVLTVRKRASTDSFVENSYKKHVTVFKIGFHLLYGFHPAKQFNRGMLNRLATMLSPKYDQNFKVNDKSTLRIAFWLQLTVLSYPCAYCFWKTKAILTGASEHYHNGINNFLIILEISAVTRKNCVVPTDNNYPI